MGLFSSKPAPEPTPDPHYIDTYGTKGSNCNWQFKFDSKDEALTFLDEVITAITDEAIIRRGNTVVNGKFLTGARYRDYYNTYYL